MSESSKRFGAAGVLVHLFLFGLVAAGIAILFGLASFSLFDRRVTLLRACTGGSATEFIYPCSAVAPYTQEHAPIKIDLPSLPDATTPLVHSAQNPTFSDVLSQEPGPRSNFVLLPDQKANAAKLDICVNVVRATGSNGLTVTSRGRELGADMVPAGSIDSVGTGDHAAARGHQRVG